MLNHKRAAVLAVIEQNAPIGAHDLIAECADLLGADHGIAIHPTLRRLRAAELIQRQALDCRVVYYLSGKGRRVYQRHLDELRAIFRL